MDGGAWFPLLARSVRVCSGDSTGGGIWLGVAETGDGGEGGRWEDGRMGGWEEGGSGRRTTAIEGVLLCFLLLHGKRDDGPGRDTQHGFG